MSRFASDLGRIVRELPDALVILESDGEISWVNQACIDLLGLDPTAWLGRSVFDLLHEDDHSLAFSAFETVGSHERGSLIDVRVQDGEGRWRQMEIRGRSVPGDTDGDDFIVIIFRDIADRQNL